jgi:hypothetical protein
MRIAAPGQTQNPLFSDQNPANLSISNHVVKKKPPLYTELLKSSDRLDRSHLAPPPIIPHVL